MNVTKYDTLKDATGQTWRVMDINESTLKIKKVVEGKNTPGKARTINITEVGEQYKLLDLPKVTVTQTKPAPSLEKEVKKIFASGDPDAIDDLIISDAEKMLEAENDDLREKLKLAHTDIDALENEVTDLRKTISKLKQEHESEVAEFKDRIMELEILAKKKNEYADALDDDTVLFSRIYTIAFNMQSLAETLESMALMIREDTEDRM